MIVKMVKMVKIERLEKDDRRLKEVVRLTETAEDPIPVNQIYCNSIGLISSPFHHLVTPRVATGSNVESLDSRVGSG